MKSEPGEFSISDLEAKGREPWTGVRNYQARNFIRSMHVGDRALFYHSNAKPMGVVGVMDIVSEPYDDPTANDGPGVPKLCGGNEKRWSAIDVQFAKTLDRMVTLAELKAAANQRSGEVLRTMALLQRGSRLSVLPITEAQFTFIVGLSHC
jgi:predicted RNA-binding protein with PUA-like domain